MIKENMISYKNAVFEYGKILGNTVEPLMVAGATLKFLTELGASLGVEFGYGEKLDEQKMKEKAVEKIVNQWVNASGK